MSTWALILVKARATGKARLARVLAAEERTRLVCSMLDRVLAAARGCTQLDAVALMSPERGCVPRDVHLLPDSGADLNNEVVRAVRTLGRRGAHRVAIIPADLPLLRSDDIHVLLNASVASGLALAPDHHQCGTNAICLRLPTVFRVQFGPGSFARHVADAARLGLVPAVVRLPGFAFDVDDPADLIRLTSGIRTCPAQHA
jgi:2-phospho-L-lactate guanylyltransferase